MTISTSKVSQARQITPKIKVSALVLRGGGGHYTTFCAIQDVLAQQRPHWQIKPIFVDSLGEGSKHRKASKISQATNRISDQFYDLILKAGWGWIHLITIHIHKVLTWVNHAVEVELLAELWQQEPPDLVLSVVPFHNRALWASLRQINAKTPIVSILTDFADSPPAYWIEPKTDNYLVCGTKKAAEQAIAAGVTSDRVIQTSGLVIHPNFYQPRAVDLAVERKQLGLDAKKLTGLVLLGANGSNVMIEIAKRLAAFQNRLQLILMCGRNQTAANTLTQLSHQSQNSQKWAVVPFTTDMPYYMNLADFFIGKPGNVSVTEALVMNLPVILERNFLTLPQERYAADWVREREVGLTVSNFRFIGPAVEQFLEPGTFAKYYQNVAAIKNQTVFEIPTVLDQIFAANTTHSSRIMPTESKS